MQGSAPQTHVLLKGQRHFFLTIKCGCVWQLPLSGVHDEGKLPPAQVLGENRNREMRRRIQKWLVQDEVTAEVSSGLRSPRFWVSNRRPPDSFVTQLAFYIQKTWLPVPALLRASEHRQVTSLLRVLTGKIGLMWQCTEMWDGRHLAPSKT